MAVLKRAVSILLLCVLVVVWARIDADDCRFMKMALDCADKARGKTSPNPIVGCVIVDQTGQVIGKGWHHGAGLPHAEVNALKDTGRVDLTGCTAYVTLEPCNHYGRTPPCTLALIRANISRVVSGTVDPDSRVSGQGIENLRRNNVKVDVAEGDLNDLCRQVNAPYIYRILNQKPYVQTLRPSRSAWNSLLNRFRVNPVPADNDVSILMGASGHLDTIVFSRTTLHKLLSLFGISQVARFIHNFVPANQRVALCLDDFNNQANDDKTAKDSRKEAILELANSLRSLDRVAITLSSDDMTSGNGSSSQSVLSQALSLEDLRMKCFSRLQSNGFCLLIYDESDEEITKAIHGVTTIQEELTLCLDSESSPQEDSKGDDVPLRVTNFKLFRKTLWRP